MVRRAPTPPDKNVNSFKERGVPDFVTYSGARTSTAGSTLTNGFVAKVAEPLAYPEARDEVYKARIKFRVFKINPLKFENSVLEGASDAIANSKKFLTKKFNNFVEGVEDSFTGESEPNRDIANELTQGGLGGGEQTFKEAGEKAQADKITDNITGELSKEGVFESLMPQADLSEPVVSMFVPISVTFNDGAIYDDAASLGVTGSGTLAALGDGGSNVGSIARGIYEGGMSIFGRGSNDGLGGDLGRVAATRIAQIAPFLPQGVRNAVSLSTQTALNPNTRPLFRNVQIRTFTFAFKMIPESQREAATVEKIVEHFRKNVYPEVIPEDLDGFSIAYRFPKLFDISFDYGGKKMAIPKIEKCYLRNVQVVYNSTSATFHSDGQPNEIDMTLTFVERKTLSRQDIEKKGM